jgi:SagB-type dehydrogenase family enzyme
MITSPAEYQRSTSYRRNQMGGHFLDWSNQPNVFKAYAGLAVKSLPEPAGLPEVSLEQLIEGSSSAAGHPKVLDLASLSRICHLSYGLTARSRHPGGEFHYRSVPSAGALFPCELYLAVQSFSNLEDGLYHFNSGTHGLTLLRSGSYFSSGDPASGERSTAGSRVMFFVTAIFFRSAWKYRDRAYRYHLLDAGHVVESLVLALRSWSLNAQVHYDFDDREINAFLGCSEEQEVCLAMVVVDRDHVGLELKAEGCPPLPENVRAAARVAPREVAYPSIQRIHQITSLGLDPGSLTPGMAQRVFQATVPWQPLPTGSLREARLSYPDAVRSRRSSRNFVPHELPRDRFAALLRFICADWGPPESRSHRQEGTVAMGFLAQKVEGFANGCYAMDRFGNSIGILRQGSFHDRMAHICLDQDWMAQGSLHFFFAADLVLLESLWGPRGYRYAMLTAGRLGHRVYLGATALEMGCCGIGAFYDGEAAELLALRESSAMLYLLCAGPLKKLFSRQIL